MHAPGHQPSDGSTAEICMGNLQHFLQERALCHDSLPQYISEIYIFAHLEMTKVLLHYMSEYFAAT